MQCVSDQKLICVGWQQHHQRMERWQDQSIWTAEWQAAVHHPRRPPSGRDSHPGAGRQPAYGERGWRGPGAPLGHQRQQPDHGGLHEGAQGQPCKNVQGTDLHSNKCVPDAAA